jgi:hypothetical protein
MQKKSQAWNKLQQKVESNKDTIGHTKGQKKKPTMEKKKLEGA